jgi:predicted Zn-dependent protease
MLARAPARRRPRRLLGLLVLVIAPTSASCVNVFTIEQDVSMGRQAYEEFLQQSQVVASGPDATLVQDVTGHLTAVAEERHPDVQGKFEWQASLVQSDEVNAFCLPGGYMAVYTGILPVTLDAGGLAVVMGHEIAHATLRHGTQKVTRSMGFEAVVMLAQQYVSQVDPDLVRSGLNALVGLPYSREAELEADREGLLTMAAAGYDPRAAVLFWQRMAQAGGEKPPEWLSTHPSDERRIAELQAMLPEAVALYERAKGLGPASAP